MQRLQLQDEPPHVRTGRSKPLKLEVVNSYSCLSFYNVLLVENYMLDKLLLNVSSSENKDFIIKVPDHGKDSVSTCSSMDLEPERHKCFSTSHPHLSRNSVRREDSGPNLKK